MYVYIVESRYENNPEGSSHDYVEDVFSSVEKAEEYVREFDPEDDFYVIDSGLTYDAHDRPKRHFSSADYARELTVYCECWEVK